jgi:hypothetical protein
MQAQGGSYTELGRLQALWSTGRLSTWGALCSCVQSKAPLALRSSLVCVLVIRSRLGCSYLSECRISRTCYYPKSSATNYVFFSTSFAAQPVFLIFSFHRNLFFTDDVPLDDMLAPCFVLHWDLVFYMDPWIALGAGYFCYKYRFLGRFPAS